MSLTAIIVIIAAVVIIGIIGYTATREKPVMETPATMMEKTSDAKVKDETKMMKSGGSYDVYSADKLALASEETVVLFFHATWCPVCRSIEAEIKASPASLPAGVHILKVDFDTATDLRQKYGVTSQYTFVQVDAQGKAIQKWSSTTLAGVLSKL